MRTAQLLLRRIVHLPEEKKTWQDCGNLQYLVKRAHERAGVEEGAHQRPCLASGRLIGGEWQWGRQAWICRFWPAKNWRSESRDAIHPVAMAETFSRRYSKSAMPGWFSRATWLKVKKIIEL